MSDISVDLSEVIEEGIASLYPDQKERWLAMFEIAEQLQHNSVSATGGDILRRLSDPEWHGKKVKEAGLCPSCGTELETQTASESHPYGSTMVRERTSLQVCPSCGEV